MTPPLPHMGCSPALHRSLVLLGIRSFHSYLPSPAVCQALPPPQPHPVIRLILWRGQWGPALPDCFPCQSPAWTRSLRAGPRASRSHVQVKSFPCGSPLSVSRSTAHSSVSIHIWGEGIRQVASSPEARQRNTARGGHSNKAENAASAPQPLPGTEAEEVLPSGALSRLRAQQCSGQINCLQAEPREGHTRLPQPSR